MGNPQAGGLNADPAAGRAPKGFDLRLTDWEDVIAAMFGEHGDLPGRLVRDGECEAEEDVRPVREPDDYALVAGEVARRKALAILAVPFTEVLPQAGSPSL